MRVVLEEDAEGGLFVIPQNAVVQGYSGGCGQLCSVSWGSRLGIEGELFKGGSDVSCLMMGYKVISLIETCMILQ